MDNKQTVLTTAGNRTSFMTPIGTLQLTAEECNEILMKRAVVAAQQQNQATIATTADGQHTGTLTLPQYNTKCVICYQSAV